MNKSFHALVTAVFFFTTAIVPIYGSAEDLCGWDEPNEHAYKIPKISRSEIKKLVRYTELNQDQFVPPPRDGIPVVEMERPAPPTSPPTTPAGILRKTVRDLEAWLEREPILGEDGSEPRQVREIVAGMDDLSRALDALTAPPDLPAMSANIIRAFDNLQRAQTRGVLDPLLAQGIYVDLTAMTGDVLAAAISATTTQSDGAGSVAEAREFYDQGKRLEQARNYGDAVVAFNHAFQFFSFNFSVTIYAQNLDTLLHNNVVGHAYVIAKDGLIVKINHEGYSRTAEDPPTLPHDIGKPQEIASISKTITAVAVHQLLDKNNISLDASIAPYLPSSWNLHYSINNLTFRRLLTHTSGIHHGTGVAYYVLRNQMAFGVFNDNFEYSNANYALFRILIPALMGISLDTYELLDQFFENNPMPPEKAAAIFYSYYVKEHVLDPMGINDAVIAPRGTNPTLLYTLNVADNGILAGNYSMDAGAYGWNLSAWELTTFLINLRYNPNILSTNARNRMYNEYLGWADPAHFSTGLGQYGIYYNHGGDWTIETGDERIGEAHTCIMEYPNGVQTSVVMNSTRQFPPNVNQCIGLRNAYDDAWKWTVN